MTIRQIGQVSITNSSDDEEDVVRVVGGGGGDGDRDVTDWAIGSDIGTCEDVVGGGDKLAKNGDHPPVGCSGVWLINRSHSSGY